MNISVKVKPNSKAEKVEKISDAEFLLSVKSAPKENKANKAAVELLSEYLDIPKSRITIIRGHRSSNKIISID